MLCYIVECLHYYGSDCNTACGHCAGSDICDSVTGRCDSGCQDNWQGAKCDGKTFYQTMKVSIISIKKKVSMLNLKRLADL